MAKAGNPDRAEAIARTMTDPDLQVEALSTVAEVVGLPGACRLIGEAFVLGP